MENIKAWFPLYAGDWLTSMGLRLCSPFTRGILIDLMAYSWQTGTPGIIKEDHTDLSLFFHCTKAEFSNAIAELDKRNCIIRDNGNIMIPRLQSVAKEQNDKHKRRVDAGRKGGIAKGKSSKEPDEDIAMLKQADSNALPIDKIRLDKTREEETRKEKKKVKRFKPPTIAELQCFIKEKGYSINAENFIAFYESKGWMVGKNKMKCWKSAASGWNLRDNSKSDKPAFEQGENNYPEGIEVCND